MATVGTTELDTWWTLGGAWSATVSINAADLPAGSPKDRVVFVLRRKNSHGSGGSPSTSLVVPSELTAGPTGGWSVTGTAISQAGLRADHARRDELPSTLTWTMSVASGAPQSTGFLAVTPIIIRAGDVTYSATSNRDVTDPIRTGDITNADRGVSLAMIATFQTFHRIPPGGNIEPDPLELDSPEGWTLAHTRVDDTNDPGAPPFLTGYWSQLSIAERTLPAGTHTAPSWHTLPFSELNFSATNIMLNAVWTPGQRPIRSVGIIMR